MSRKMTLQSMMTEDERAERMYSEPGLSQMTPDEQAARDLRLRKQQAELQDAINRGTDGERALHERLYPDTPTQPKKPPRKFQSFRTTNSE